MVDGFAVDGEAGGAVGHDALPLCPTNGRAQVRLGRRAEEALAALGGVARNHAVAFSRVAGGACQTTADQ